MTVLVERPVGKLIRVIRPLEFFTCPLDDYGYDAQITTLELSRLLFTGAAGVVRGQSEGCARSCTRAGGPSA